MTQSASSSTLIQQVHEGMDVYDGSGEKVGTVERVYFGPSAGTAGAPGTGAATTEEPSSNQSLIGEIANSIFGADTLPETVRDRLMNQGFIRVNSTGLFSADRYFTPDQIASVRGERVDLNVTREAAIKR